MKVHRQAQYTWRAQAPCHRLTAAWDPVGESSAVLGYEAGGNLDSMRGCCFIRWWPAAGSPGGNPHGTSV